MLIWSNLILDLREISNFHTNLKSNYSKLTQKEDAVDTSGKDYSNDKDYSFVCVKTVLSKLLRLLFKVMLLRNHNRK